MPAPNPKPPSYTPRYRPSTAADYQPIRYAVGIKLLVYYDGFVGLSNLAFGAVAIRNDMDMLGGIMIAVGLAALTLGGVLFTRQLWAYWLAFIGHAAMLLLHATDLVLAFLLDPQKPNFAGIVGWALVFCLLALCTQRAWHLIRQVWNERAAARRDAELQAPPTRRSWDEKPIQ